MKYPEGLPIHSKQFAKLQYLLYNGVNQDEKDFRKMFITNLIQDFEKEEGSLSREQKQNLIVQFEEELFCNYEHLKTLEDVLDNLESEFGFFKKYKKEINLDWVDAEIVKSREMYLMNTPSQIKDQREFLDKELVNQKKFLNIGIIILFAKITR